MSHIIAGRFETQDGAKAVVDQLYAAHFPAEQVSCFYVGPPGQHARFPLGGDHNVSCGAEEGSIGGMKGTATGGVVGAAIGSVGGPLGFLTGGLVGAHIGNLIGVLSKMHSNEESSVPDSILRHSGFMVAVCTPDEHSEQAAINMMRAGGAVDLESGDGHIVHGDWEDFDPAEAPHRIPAQRAPGTSTH